MQPLQSDRRRFLKTAGAAVAMPYVITTSALGGSGKLAASERIVMATIGCGGQGTGDMQGFLGFPQVQMVAVCDPVPAIASTPSDIVNEHYNNQDCKDYNDFREVLARPDIDAVLIGTPDHWHALITIEACKHGKDVYCEKPECLTIREGRAMVEAVEPLWPGVLRRQPARAWRLRRLGRGLSAAGRSARSRKCSAIAGGRRAIATSKPQTIPPGVDWDMWLGPAPWRPFHDSLINGGFRPYRDYSGGGMTDWGAHRFGAAMFAAGVHKTGPVEVIPPDGKDHKLLTYGSPTACGCTTAAPATSPTRAPRASCRASTAPPPRAWTWQATGAKGGIFGDFLHCVKTRELPFRNIEVAHRATTVCHLGNIAYWLKRPLKWDPVAEQIVGDPEANRWLDRPKREPWTLLSRYKESHRPPNTKRD